MRLKNKIITHLGSWNTNQTNKQNKTTRRQKLDPTPMPMPLEIKIMMCAQVEGLASWFTHFFPNNIMAKLLSYLCWHGNKSKNKRKMLTVLYCFLKGWIMPIKKIQFPKLLTKVKGLTHRWNISVAYIRHQKKVERFKQNCAVLLGYSYWTNFSATRHHNLTKIKTQHSAYCW